MEIRISLRKTVLSLLLVGIVIAGIIWIPGLLRPSPPPPVPRRTALPRIQAPPAEYTSLCYGDISFDVNRHATVTVRDSASGWWDINYNPYPVTLYLTLGKVAPEDIEDVIQNRLQRIQLNLGGRKAVSMDFSNDSGWQGVIIRSSEVTSTPVQFFANDPEGHIVTGTMFISDQSATNGSEFYNPHIDFVLRDVMHALNRLGADEP